MFSEIQLVFSNSLPLGGIVSYSQKTDEDFVLLTTKTWINITAIGDVFPDYQFKCYLN